ncbi:hypothetical protein [Nisaea nitritireducens]|uniref:hypothetical protein n=1 Tax=Nisaea nitritireducens TaxID=568392 RepID=UPI0018684794|nr:hypothetical protein [Nisaea nitritireducens]
MLLIERLFASFTIWLCNLCDVTQADVDRHKEQEFGIKAVPHHAESLEAANGTQLVVRFRK